MTRAAHGGGRETFFGLGRGQFPRLLRAVEGRKRLVYLDNACTALKLRAPAEKMRDFALQGGGCAGGRSMHALARRSEEAVAQTRAATAAYLGAASPREIVFTSGTTEAVNLLARGLPASPGRREIIVTDLEHNSAYLPFYERARRDGLSLIVAKTKRGRLDLKALARLVSKKTMLVAIPRSSNVFGGVLPLDAVCDLAHDAGAFVFADEAQYLQSHREDVQETGVDFAAFSAHKLGGPFGVGVLYGKEHLLNTLEPHKPGGGTVAGLRAPAGFGARIIWTHRGALRGGFKTIPASSGSGKPCACTNASTVRRFARTSPPWSAEPSGDFQICGGRGCWARSTVSSRAPSSLFM